MDFQNVIEVFLLKGHEGNLIQVSIYQIATSLMLHRMMIRKVRFHGP